VIYDRIVRWLHAGIALTVVIQLTTSGIMQVPQPGRALLEPQHFFFVMHEWSGMTLVALLVLHWLWVSGGHLAGGWGHLYPWFSRSRLRALFACLKALPAWLREAHSLPPKTMDPLAGAVHGLGLLTITAMALTGAAMVLGMGSGGSMGGFLRAVRWAHVFIASLVWAYLFGHVAMAVLHQVRGERLVTKMFNLFAR
jgi:cytochrome b561